MKKLNPKFTRRQILEKSGKMAMALPFLPALFSAEAEAAGTVPLRFIAIHSFMGQRQEYWLPKTVANIPFTGEGREIALSSFSSTGISPILGTLFTPYLSKMTMIQGLDKIVGNGHNNQDMLGHFSVGNPIPTIDQVLAKSSRFYGGITPVISSFRFGEPFSHGYSGANFTQLPTYENSYAAFQRVYGLGQPATLLRQANVVDRTLNIYNRLRANPKLSSADQNLIDTQGSLLSDLSNRLKLMKVSPSCVKPVINLQGENNEQFLTNAVDMIVSSFLCDNTRVATIGIKNPDPVSNSDSWHGMSHNHEGAIGVVPDVLRINKWIAEKFIFQLASKMDSIIEANGKSILDNSLIYWGNEISFGEHHTSEDMPVLLFGGAQGKLRTGYIYDFRKLTTPGQVIYNQTYYGRPYNQLLVTILQAMGLSPADYEVPGIKGYGISQSSSSERNQKYASFINEVGSPIPRFFIG